ncbi:unnamed protein product [Allacma fusca]|uniref:Uncharacterized protein n=1 Tax=Allacma fusca TaxID=39272 RepID=A0A8J2KSU6_9HEXA|nr:unnamed protein product [Allacma fusca]
MKLLEHLINIWHWLKTWWSKYRDPKSIRDCVGFVQQNAAPENAQVEGEPIVDPVYVPPIGGEIEEDPFVDAFDLQFYEGEHSDLYTDEREE